MPTASASTTCPTRRSAGASRAPPAAAARSNGDSTPAATASSTGASDAPATQQCEAVLPATGRRCPQTVGIDADGFCTAHRAVNTELPRCLGVLPGSDKRCRSNAKTGYDYCCAAHDPKFAATFVPPSLFNDPGLRSSVEAEIVRRFKGRDLYHGDKLDLNTVGAVELDHILEKQCFAYAFQRVEFRDGEEEAQDVVFMLREEIVNELPNLCLTRATTNKMKGAAVSRFLDDSLTGHRGEKTFTDYMLAEKRDDTRLARDVTRTIRSEMGTALRRCQWKLVDAGETPALDALSAELQQLYVDMGLHTSHSGKTKPRATVTTASKAPEENKDAEYVLVEPSTPDTWTVVDVKRSVKVEPKLSADAKPFVPGATQSATDAKVAHVAVDRIKRELDEVENKISGCNANVASTVDTADCVKKEESARTLKGGPEDKQLASEPSFEGELKKEKPTPKRASRLAFFSDAVARAWALTIPASVQCQADGQDR
ncbi:hypothetical protein ON010_g5759 [Phytophthora cinnamomi]|nr:hypothetical protein ON010_g5759 [Phytophthora cinnamomi]